MFSGILVAEIFDMDAICDPSTLDIEVLQDWHRVEGEIETRQKLVTINVGELWPRPRFPCSRTDGCACTVKKAKGFSSDWWQYT